MQSVSPRLRHHRLGSGKDLSGADAAVPPLIPVPPVVRQLLILGQKTKVRIIGFKANYVDEITPNSEIEETAG